MKLSIYAKIMIPVWFILVFFTFLNAYLFSDYTATVIMDIPVIICTLWYPKTCREDERYLNFNWEQFRTPATAKCELKDLEKTIKYVLRNPDELKEERIKTTITDAGIDIKNPTDEICKIILSK